MFFFCFFFCFFFVVVVLSRLARQDKKPGVDPRLVLKNITNYCHIYMKKYKRIWILKSASHMVLVGLTLNKDTFHYICRKFCALNVKYFLLHRVSI